MRRRQESSKNKKSLHGVGEWIRLHWSKSPFWKQRPVITENQGDSFSCPLEDTLSPWRLLEKKHLGNCRSRNLQHLEKQWQFWQLFLCPVLTDCLLSPPLFFVYSGFTLDPIIHPSDFFTVFLFYSPSAFESVYFSKGSYAFCHYHSFPCLFFSP